MSFTPADMKKVAHLARLTLSDDEIERHTTQLGRILDFIEQMQQTNTQGIEPLAHALDVNQRLREDMVTEANLRDKYQKIAPQVEAGLYLVPKVIE